MEKEILDDLKSMLQIEQNFYKISKFMIRTCICFLILLPALTYVNFQRNNKLSIFLNGLSFGMFIYCSLHTTFNMKKEKAEIEELKYKIGLFERDFTNEE